MVHAREWVALCRLALVWLAAVMLLSLPLAAASQSGADCAGVLFSRVPHSSAAADIGIESGDRLHSWRFIKAETAIGMDASGLVCSVFDYWRVLVEAFPRGSVELHGERGGEPVAWRFDGGPWALPTPQPVFSEELTALWAVAKPLRNVASDEASKAWAEMLAVAAVQATVPVRSWLLMERGFGLVTHGHAEAGEQWLVRAYALARAEYPWEAARIQLTRGQLAKADRDRSTELVQQARDAWRILGDELWWAFATEILGSAAIGRGDLDEAEDYFREVEQVRRRVAAGSVAYASSLHNLGVVSSYRGDQKKAVTFIKEARLIQERYRPARRLVSTLFTLAALHALLGQTQAQMEAAEEAVRVGTAIDLGGVSQAGALINLSTAVVALGDLTRAEELARRAVVFAEQGDSSQMLSNAHQHLGWIAEELGDWGAAEGSYRQGVEILEAAESRSPELVNAWMSLGFVLTELGDLDGATEALEAGQRHLNGHAPSSFYAVPLQAFWADLLLEQERPKAALERADRALSLALETELAGNYALVAHQVRGRALLALGRFQEARTAARATVELAQRIAPETAMEARALEVLGGVELRAGRWEQAQLAYCRGVTLLERQVVRLGKAADSGVRFRGRYLGLFEGCAEARLAAGAVEQALHVLERSRAWKTRQVLAERGVMVGAEGDAEMTVRFRRLAIEHDEILESLATGDWQGNATEVAAKDAGLLARLDALHLEREQLLAEARKADPRLAAIIYPEPLTATQASRNLGKHDLLIAFDVTEDATLAFLMEPSGKVQGLRLAFGEAKLTQLVDAFLESIVSRRNDATLRTQAEQLLTQLLSPLLGDVLQGVLGGADEETSDGLEPPVRLYVMADGPLLRLPWSALGHHDMDGVWRWLAEDLATTVIPSMTVLAELRARPAVEGTSVAIFGDPAFAATNGEGAQIEGALGDGAEGLRSLLELRGPLRPLPGSRLESTAIAKVFSGDLSEASSDDRVVEMFLGSDASERNARRLGSGHRMIHFASHALIDEVHPLESGLVLATPTQVEAGVDNGFLQAWEIIADLRLDADLVTLSACSTARGAEVRGEGVLGLSSAFLHAGARSVVASLWPVSDASTARLMEAFYRHQANGVARDQALRRAQLELLRGEISVDTRSNGGRESGDTESSADAERAVGGLRPRSAQENARSEMAPFSWAAFQLIGDPGYGARP